MVRMWEFTVVWFPYMWGGLVDIMSRSMWGGTWNRGKVGVVCEESMGRGRDRELGCTHVCRLLSVWIDHRSEILEGRREKWGMVSQGGGGGGINGRQKVVWEKRGRV